MKKINWRNCPDCNIEMEYKFSLPGTRDYEDGDDEQVMQCPKCKRIETGYELKLINKKEICNTNN